MSDDRPTPRTLTTDEVTDLLAAHRFGVLATVKRSGHPHLTTVAYDWRDGVARVSTTADRVKARQVQADPRVALHVSPDVWSFAVVEGDAEVSAPSAEPGDAVGLELLGMTPGFADPAEERAFLVEQVRERRVVIRLRAAKLYGTKLDV
ncbi:TIGR03618 family F420-dependent PPOX class oxidoreductase [Saccharothrix sp. Mg75]|uniref:TIGR03618 family F420-dependent PPOX class oxidoreductase n=1 Tax=Saccharothrix sp. Mg75 TaxID=3445357 RepID=UPI003EF04173